MISAKKLLKFAKKWQKLAASKRKRITLQKTARIEDTSSCSTSAVVEKGHFVVYSADQKRFMLPLEFLNNEMMRNLFNLAEEEFELQSNSHLTLPCDAELMGYAISLIKQQVTSKVQNAFLMSISSSCSSWSSSVQDQVNRHNQPPILSF